MIKKKQQTKMRKKSNTQSEKGSITIFITVAVLFLITTITSIYFISVNNRTSQKQEISNIQDQYREDDLEGIYSDQKDKMPDTQAPTATITVSGYNIAGAILGVNATIRSTDNKSGVDFANSKYVFTTSQTEIGVDETSYTDGSLTGKTTVVNKTKPAGTYYLHVLLVDNEGNKGEAISETSVAVAGKVDFTYTGAEQSINLPAGKYKLEVWGAQGGDYSTTYVGGKGGYSKGTITLTDPSTTLYAYVGGSGGKQTTSGTLNGGFNGGGSTYTSSSSYPSCSGGRSI